ncbi:hypothetical protein Asppvi_003784 [Aspergillus pseudoviridinutans]|uniref:Uncharacterized protein n=1 Tax=Aspergillus pseudoviridinutans TaxID=1517512 RepID=A0A9P3BBH3_9EURO|nr:uncharacterized protein Asppvi_003784 [Aspergillus pseudoviridinutans]GIJ84929.1 hypothetical protein Asppvi_003784 [Aspergillus pseudoviridinutans]
MAHLGQNEHTIAKRSNLDDAFARLHKVSGEVKILRRFAGKRQPGLVSNAVRIMSTEQPEGPFQDYQKFLHDILKGESGRSMVTLCSGSLGKSRVVGLGPGGRTALVKYITDNRSRLDCETLSSLASLYKVPSAAELSLEDTQISDNNITEGDRFQVDESQPRRTSVSFGSRADSTSHNPNKDSSFIAETHLHDQNRKNSKGPTTVPLNLAAIEVLQDVVKEGHGDRLQIVFPDPFVQQPFMRIPLEIASKIMQKYTVQTA